MTCVVECAVEGGSMTQMTDVVGMQWKVAPALAAGNCCILKPSELCSLTCLEMAAIAHAVGLPPGVFSVITGTGLNAGAPLRYTQTPLHIISTHYT